MKHDKADVVFSKIRMECKRTDKEVLPLEKAWIAKIKRDIRPDEFFVVELEVQDERVYLISEEEFEFLKWMLLTPREGIIQALQEGEYGRISRG